MQLELILEMPGKTHGIVSGPTTSWDIPCQSKSIVNKTCTVSSGEALEEAGKKTKAMISQKQRALGGKKSIFKMLLLEQNDNTS